LKQPVLITGAAGFAGSHLLQHLAGHRIVAWTRRAPPPELAALAEWRQVDILHAEQVNAAVGDSKPGSVFHCAGLPQVAESWSDAAAPLQVNALGTHRLFDALRRAGLHCRVVVAGSAHVYAPSDAALTENDPLAPASPYALSKLAQEQLALMAAAEDGLEVIVARSFNHTGPRQSPSFVAPSIARQIALIESGAIEPVIRVGNLDARRDLMDVRDTVGAYAALMSSGAPGNVYNVASGVARPVRHVLDALLARARVEIRVETDPGRMRANDIPVLAGDASRLRDETGWEPQIPFERMIDDLLEYWRDQAVAGRR
jgi:GDP-4-dehydro-6-deoxy-D-mannose reductase